MSDIEEIWDSGAVHNNLQSDRHKNTARGAAIEQLDRISTRCPQAQREFDLPRKVIIKDIFFLFSLNLFEL